MVLMMLEVRLASVIVTKVNIFGSNILVVYLQSTGGLTPVTVLLNTSRHFHEKLTNGKQSQKKVWASIAAVLIKKGYGVFCCDIACKVIKLADFFCLLSKCVH